MRLNHLNEKRALVVAEMRSITEKPTGTGGDLSTEQAQRFDQLKGDLQGLEQRIERQRFIDDAERRMTGQQIHGTGDNRLGKRPRSTAAPASLAGYYRTKCYIYATARMTGLNAARGFREQRKC